MFILAMLFFFCYHRSLHAISYQATMAKEQE